MRRLIVIADDYGMGSETSRGILELGQKGIVQGAALLVNSPDAQRAVAAWHDAGRPMELGWHVALTLDRPVLPAEKVPTLTDGTGQFLALGNFLRRLFAGSVNAVELRAEIDAQYKRYRELTGETPRFVNGHHHTHVFAPVADCLRSLFRDAGIRPYVRRVREPWSGILKNGGARRKRLFLNWHGRRAAHAMRGAGFPGNQWLLGLSDGGIPEDDFFVRQVHAARGQSVELMCHPGHHDEELAGRDEVQWRIRRVTEMRLLEEDSFQHACAACKFERAAPGDV